MLYMEGISQGRLVAAAATAAATAAAAAAAAAAVATVQTSSWLHKRDILAAQIHSTFGGSS